MVFGPHNNRAGTDLVVMDIFRAPHGDQVLHEAHALQVKEDSLDAVSRAVASLFLLHEMSLIGW